MGGYSNLHKRMNFNGGEHQQDRMILQKLKTLKASIGRSYQTATVAFGKEFDAEFKCLINPDKLKNDYDQKEISIPYKSVQINKPRVGTTTQGEVDVPVKCGEVFYWKETNSYWLIYLQEKQELAYFRGTIRLCKTYITINDNKYYITFKGPDETVIPWNSKSDIGWNSKNLSGEFYITKNEETLDFVHRFQKVKIEGKTWHIASYNEFSGKGIIKVTVMEDYNNSFEDEKQEREKIQEEAAKQEKDKLIEEALPYIEGPASIRVYDTQSYSIQNSGGGEWSIDTKKAIITDMDENNVTVRVVTSKSSQFTLSYSVGGEEVAALKVEIKSL